MSQEIVTSLPMKANCCSCSNGSNICRGTAIKELANKTLFVIEHDSKGSGNTLLVQRDAHQVSGADIQGGDRVSVPSGRGWSHRKENEDRIPMWSNGFRSV